MNISRVSLATATVICLFVITISSAREKNSECCVPTYQGVIIPSVQTAYQTNTPPRLTKIDNSPWLSRVFHSWEKIRIKIHASVVVDSYSNKNCQVSVSNPSDWFRTCIIVFIDHNDKEIVSEIAWQPVAKPLSINGDKEAKIIKAGQSVGAEISILPVDGGGKPLAPGVYIVHVQCDMKTISRRLGECDENCLKIINKKNVIGRGAIEIVQATTDIEIAEEEMHKAYWSGIHTKEATRHLENVLDIDPYNTQALEWLSTAHIKSGRISKADKLLEMCLKLEPTRRGCRYYKQIVKKIREADLR